jgi:hypothetical protein
MSVSFSHWAFVFGGAAATAATMLAKKKLARTAVLATLADIAVLL